MGVEEECSLSYPPRPRPGNDKRSPDGTKPRKQTHILIFFVPGNPGLIGYYAPFLSRLRDRLDDISPPWSTASNAAATTAADDPSPNISNASFHIHGQNLAGFVDGDHEPFTSARQPFDLEYQIQHILKAVSRLRVIGEEAEPESESVSATQQQGKQGRPYDQVLLIGHSVGAYIALEVYRRILHDSAPSSALASGGILLFPTIERIAESPSGWKLDTLRRTPFLGGQVSRVAQGLLHLCPAAALRWFVGPNGALGFPPHAADVTARWLGSRDGVWQALHLGMDEMRVIGEDKWDDELWEISQEAAAIADDTTTTKSDDVLHQPPIPLPLQLPPKFYFFFGRQDHWVADHHRDEFIRRRSTRRERTRILVDEGDIPHAFCIGHSEPVADKVYTWIVEMFGTV